MEICLVQQNVKLSKCQIVDCQIRMGVQNWLHRVHSMHDFVDIVLLQPKNSLGEMILLYKKPTFLSKMLKLQHKIPSKLTKIV